MTDPIAEAEGGIEAFAQLEILAAETREGTITLRVNSGVVTSVVAERVFPPSIANAAPIGKLASTLGYGGIEAVVKGGRIVDWEALPRRRLRSIP